MNEQKYITLDILSYFKENLEQSVDDKLDEKVPYISSDGHWYINGVDTGYSVSGNVAPISSEDIKKIFTEG